MVRFQILKNESIANKLLNWTSFEFNPIQSGVWPQSPAKRESNIAEGANS